VSKNEILKELPKLKAEERREIFDCLCDIEDLVVLKGGEPSKEEKELLDIELEAYRKHPKDGSPWAEVEARLRRSRS